MPVRGRRYPPRSLTHAVVISNNVVRVFVIWHRPQPIQPWHRNRAQGTLPIVGTPSTGSPIALPYQHHRQIVAPFQRPHISIRTSLAMSQASSSMLAYQRAQPHRPLIVVQSFARRVNIIRPQIPNTGLPIGQTIRTHTTFPIRRNPVMIRNPVTVKLPPVVIQNRPMFDMHRLPHQRTVRMIIDNNRR